MKSLHLATPDDIDKLRPLVAAFHGEVGVDSDDDSRDAALAPLLEGSPHGAVWLIGPRRSPVGYIAVTFGWSIANGGLDAVVAEFFIRPAVRRRGMGQEALNGIAKALRGGGVRALHLEVRDDDERTQRFYRRALFAPREGYLFMSRVL